MLLLQVASLEEKQVKLIEKSKQDDALLTEIKGNTKPTCTTTSTTSSTVVFTNQSLLQSTSYHVSAPVANSVKPTSAIPPSIPTPVQIPTTTENKIKINHPEITQEHILKEIQVTLEERKKLQTYVSKYEKGIQDLEKGTSVLHNVRTIFTEFMLLMPLMVTNPCLDVHKI